MGLYDVNSKTAKEKLGEKYHELLESDWKIAELPDKEIIGKDGRKINPNSLKNLVQYRKRTKKEKEIALAQLRYKEKKPVAKKKRGRPPKKKPKTEDFVVDVGSSITKKYLLENLPKIIPLEDIFHEDEIPIFVDYLKVYLNDFDDQDLSGSDLDDLVSIATNRVLELRLLKYSKATTKSQLQTAASIEKLRKQTEKLKESLAARRKDRMKGNKYNFTIVDLVTLFEQHKEERFYNRAAELLREEEEYLKNRIPHGNKEDIT